MKHIFIVNPVAGKKNAQEEIKAALKKYGSEINWELYLTDGPGDSTRYIKKFCSENAEEVRFYACGGDGTANEVASGIVGYPQASMTVYACGSGNDLIKCFGGRDNFLDIGKLIDGEEMKIDIIKVGDNYSINVLNFGFDTCVAKTMSEVKRKKIIGGKNAYTTGIIKAMLIAMKNECTIKVDGKALNDGRILLCTIANGQYVGGAFRCAPKAKLDDGFLEVCIVKPISRLRFITMINPYKEGRILDNPKFGDCVVYKKCKSVEVIAPEGFCASYDGEIIRNNHFIAEILEKKIRFVVPKI